MKITKAQALAILDGEGIGEHIHTEYEGPSDYTQILADWK